VKNIKYIVGIDEAGRGPLAGPVSVGVVVFEQKIAKQFSAKLLKLGLNDSKQLSEKKREEFYAILNNEKKAGNIDHTVSLVSASFIDNHGISKAIRLAISRSLKRLNLNENETQVLLDGSLKAPEHFKYQKTIIKGDQIEPTIMAASVLAKVRRDRLLKKVAKKYPEYGLEIHKGYGTKMHRENIKKHGVSDFHRISFCRNI
jgi:ribonuclease HII